MSLAESYIKKHLDGTFIKYQPYLDSFKLVHVPVDFIPTHENAVASISAKIIATWRSDPNRKMGRNKKRDASPEQVVEILEWYRQGLTMSAIHKRLKARGDKVSERGVRDAIAGAL